MSYSVEVTAEALANKEKLTKAVRERIGNKIDWLAENFEQITPMPLSANLAGFFKLILDIILFIISNLQETIFCHTLFQQFQIRLGIFIHLKINGRFGLINSFYFTDIVHKINQVIIIAAHHIYF